MGVCNRGLLRCSVWETNVICIYSEPSAYQKTLLCQYFLKIFPRCGFHLSCLSKQRIWNKVLKILEFSSVVSGSDFLPAHILGTEEVKPREQFVARKLFCWSLSERLSSAHHTPRPCCALGALCASGSALRDWGRRCSLSACTLSCVSLRPCQHLPGSLVGVQVLGSPIFGGSRAS